MGSEAGRTAQILQYKTWGGGIMHAGRGIVRCMYVEVIRLIHNVNSIRARLH